MVDSQSPQNDSSRPVHFIDGSHDRLELIQSALNRNSMLNARHVQCSFEDEELVLRGEVKSYYQKQLAQEMLRGLEGVGKIRNEIEVKNR